MRSGRTPRGAAACYVRKSIYRRYRLFVATYGIVEDREQGRACLRGREVGQLGGRFGAQAVHIVVGILYASLAFGVIYELLYLGCGELLFFE